MTAPPRLDPGPVRDLSLVVLMGMTAAALVKVAAAAWQFIHSDLWGQLTVATPPSVIPLWAHLALMVGFTFGAGVLWGRLYDIGAFFALIAAAYAGRILTIDGWPHQLMIELWAVPVWIVMVWFRPHHVPRPLAWMLNLSVAWVVAVIVVSAGGSEFGGFAPWAGEPWSIHWGLLLPAALPAVAVSFARLWRFRDQPGRWFLVAPFGVAGVHLVLGAFIPAYHLATNIPAIQTAIALSLLAAPVGLGLRVLGGAIMPEEAPFAARR